MIKVVVVDDSLVAQEFLAYVLTTDPDIQVVGFANDGAKALAVIQDKRPDVITMDIHMPRMDGYAATRAIMENAATPIVIVSASTGAKDAGPMFRALEAGALGVVRQPHGIGHPQHAAGAQELIRTVKMLSGIKVVKRTRRVTGSLTATLPHLPTLPASRPIELVAIGASIGGPAALLKILTLLPPGLPAPVLIVQHMAPGFIEGCVEWLAGASGFPLQMAVHGQKPAAHQGYVAPDGFHMGLDSGARITLSQHAPEYGSRPSVANLFRTVAQALGPRAVGVLLTGMGKDGAAELKLMNDRGAPTIVQDEASSVVHGMPGEAIKLGAATYVLAPEAIAATLMTLVRKPNGAP